MNTLRILALAAGVCLVTNAFAQNLPRYLSPEEQLQIRTGNTPDRIAVPGAITSPLGVDAPRSIAEWEELQAIAVTWTSYRDILAEIVKYAAKEVEVLIITRNATITRTELEDRGVNPDSNIVYIESDFNSVWIRDYGPNPVYTSDVDSLVLVDWIYNRPRPKDDIISAEIANYLGVPLLSTTEPPFDLVNTGGNYMTNGMGRGFSSNLVLDENGPGNIWGETVRDAESVDSIMAAFMGVEEYVKMTVLPYDGIHHIDMHMKVLGENLILMGEYPEGVADGPQIEANLQYILENFKLATGRDYEVVRIPMPPDQFGRYPDQGGHYRTYANAMFVNKTILVPTYEEEFDTTALRIWRETMPGFNIVGIDCNVIIPAGGAIHCITKEIGVDEPLWLYHEEPMTAEASEVVDLNVIAKHRSGIANVKIHYTDNGANWGSFDMTKTGTDTWTYSITPLVSGDTITVQYYFEATANDGKVITRPMVAPEGYFELTFFGDPTSTLEAGLNESDVRVFPNPASAITCVDIELDRPQAVRVSIIDLHGKLIGEIHRGAMAQGSNKVFFNAGAMIPGMYVVRVEGEESLVSLKLVIR